MSPRFQQKLTVPLLSGPLVDRTTLCERIEQAMLSRRLVVLAAPAGWGKTTTLAQWAALSNLPVRWYTLDTSDHDPHVFLDYLLHAVARFVPGADELAVQLLSTPPQDLGNFTRTIALAIAEAPEPFALVLDDLHLITDETSLPGTTLVIGLLASLIEYATNCHLVLASRTLPELRGLVRLIASRRAEIFDYTALQFKPTEIQQLADLSGGTPLSPDGAEQIATQLGGWVTGIVLSLDQSIQTRYGASSDGVTNTAQVYAYFAEQVISPLPEPLQRFLEETSILEDLSPQRCDALRGTHDSASFLDAITRQNLFVSRRAEWLTYHSLFREFLRDRLARDPQRARALLLRAGKLYGQEDDLERAISCYLTAESPDHAIALLHDAVTRFRRRSLHTTLLACFDHLRKGRLLPADLLLLQARVYSDLALWEPAHAAIQLAETIGTPKERWDAQILHANISSLEGDQTQAQAILDQVPLDQISLRSQLDYHIAASRIQRATDDIDASILSLERAHLLVAATDDKDEHSIEHASIYDTLGLTYALRGQREEALRYLKIADELWQAAGNTGRRAATLNNLGMLAMEGQQYNEARKAFTNGLDIAQKTGRRRTETSLLCSLAELELIEGQLQAALTAFGTAYTMATDLMMGRRVPISAVGAQWAAALARDTRAATHWQQRLKHVKMALPLEVQGRAALADSLLALTRGQPTIEVLSQYADRASAAADRLINIDRAYLALLRATIALQQGGWTRAAPEWATFEGWAADIPFALLLHMLPAHYSLLVTAARSMPLAQQLVDALKDDAAAGLVLPSSEADQMQAVGQPVMLDHDVSIALPPEPTTNDRAAATISSPADPTHWYVVALGQFTCLADGVACNLSSMHQALLVRLLDAGPGGLSVDRLWESVWGDDHLSMATLHQALRRLRTQTGLSISAKDGQAAIRSGWDTLFYDVRAFERALQSQSDQQSLEHAISLYNGEFLPSAPIGAALWATARRDQLQQRYLDALDQLADMVARESPQQAIHAYQQVLQIDGGREQTASKLMRLAARVGNRSLINTTFEQLQRTLRAMGLSPSPETNSVYHELKTS